MFRKRLKSNLFTNIYNVYVQELTEPNLFTNIYNIYVQETFEL